MVGQSLPQCILNHFQRWKDIICWVVCNDKKQPCEKRTGKLAKWRSDPQDNIITLDELNELASYGVVDLFGGFGIILGQDNLLCCIDFDHVLDDNGEVINPDVEVFLKDCHTFVEKSSGGHGLHAFFNLESSHEEYGLNKSFCDGKFYVDRFIKMTGVVFKEYDYPVRTIKEKNFDIIKKRIGEQEISLNNQGKENSSGVLQNTNTNTRFDGKIESWEFVLSSACIPYIQSNYSGKVRRGKLVIESWRIECPNKSAHNTDRPGDPSAHLAILNKYADGTTSLSCSHNSCSPHSHPNLLQKLWDKIRNSKKSIGKKFIESMKVM